MRWLFFSFVILMSVRTNGQDYFYSFAGSGASAKVSTVKVYNLTTGATLSLYGNEILHLTGKREIPSSESDQNAIKIYPNPVTSDHTVLQIHPPFSGSAVIRIYDLTGKTGAQIQTYLGNYTQEFCLSGVSNGFYLIKVIGKGYHYSAKLLWNGTADGPVSLVKISDNNPSDENMPENNYDGIHHTVIMSYSFGDRLMFKGISGNYSTIIMDIPSGDKKITFPFYSCCDADNNNYTVVEIGSQIWMAENLMTTRYSDGNAIAYPGINNYSWNNDTIGSYAWYNNNEASNKNIYGALYNWHAVNTGILCPSGWHVPTDREWIILNDYLGGTNVAGGKLKDTGTAYWYSPNNKSTNESGFSALPGGMSNLTGFSDIKSGGHWWSSTFYRNWQRPSGWHLDSGSEILDKNIANSANEGFSVRCVIGQSAVSIPFVMTNEIKDISANSATGSAMVISNEGSAITDFGICWDIFYNPTIENQKKSNETGDDVFTVNITGLKPGTTYHVRAYVTNSAGTAYGDDLSFTTQVALPVLTTSTVTNIRPTTAGSGGNITYDGGGAITERGVCWAITLNPTISNSKITAGSGTGSFIGIMTGLQPGATYHVRAYATNSAGTAYGDNQTFRTLTELPVLTTSAVTNITQTTAASGGNITYDGGGSIMARGVCWATTVSPTINDSRTSNGTGTGSFISSITGLQPGTTYHVRAYVTNSAGTAYGDDLSFTTQVALPVLTTSTVTNIRPTTAASGGNITYDGGGVITERGVCWATTLNPTISNSKIAAGSGTGSFTGIMTGLQPGATYHVRAYATNSAGTAYGNQVNFNTIPEAPPVVDFYVPDEGKLLHSVGDKRIIFKKIGTDDYIKFSNNNGVSYNVGVRVTGIFTGDHKARILGNGNIVLFCANRIYYSDDDMETINPCIVLKKDGSAYSCHEPVNPAYSGAYFNFMSGFIEDSGVCLLGNYTNSSMGASPVNLYYSLDGITWRVIYTFGQDLRYTDNGTATGGYGGTLLGDPGNSLITRHIHSINIGDDGSFYTCTGDCDGEIHILKCSYDRSADSWTINDLLSAESMNWQRMRSLGVFERNGYIYWGSDGPGTFTFKGVVYESFGIYKCPVNDINDPSKHILLQSLPDACYSFLNVGHNVIAGLQSYGYVYISFNYGETWSAFQKPSWMTGSVEGVWFNESQKYFGTCNGVVISSVSF